ncbi:MAG TPA: 2-dehydropantoate 2-reductase, partial [Alcanivorax sp.]|nr:2-dehydropantoate 2-reductase [Alcanivorax sp.]
MKIAVVGCGAMGSIYAALFASAGNEVFAVDANEAHVQAINEKGLRLSGVSGDRTVRIEAFSEAPQKTADLIIVAVKATHVPSAITNILALLEADSIVLAIQNGLGSAEQLAAALGKRGLLIGVAQGFGASLPAPGVAHHNDMKAIKIGSLTVGG